MRRIDQIVSRASRWLVSCTAALAAAAVVAAPAHGQLGGNVGFADMASRDYLHRDMPIVAQVLELDDNQRVILDNLFEDYVEAFESGWEQTQSKITNMLDNGQNITRENALDIVLRPFEDWAVEKRQMKQQFESSIRSILNERQLELWPQFERRIVREKTLHHGRLSGESVNLISIVRDLRMDERSRLNVEPVLEEYAIDLHDALRRRNEASQRLQNEMFQVIRAGQDLTAQADAHRAVIQFHVAVRDVNDRYRDRLASSLPHEIGKELRTTALERGYPRVYRELPALRAYRQALELEELDEETREAVQDLYTIFEAEMDVLNSRLLVALREFEPRQLRNEVDVYMSRQAGEPISRVEDPTRRDIRHRDERATYYLSLLRDLLGEEQFAQLPAGRRLVDDDTRREAAAAARQRIRERREQMEQSGETGPARGGARQAAPDPRRQGTRGTGTGTGTGSGGRR
jgi:hypothetical protein